MGTMMALLLGFGCAGSAPVEEAQSAAPTQPPAVVHVVDPAAGKFIHTVLFWVKEGTTDEQVQQLIDDCKTLLGAVESVRYLAAGPPAGTPRDVVDNSYAVGLVVHFEDAAGHDYYADAPKHLEFIEKNQEIWERVQVYDMLVE
jgi:hypothetical protein